MSFWFIILYDFVACDLILRIQILLYFLKGVFGTLSMLNTAICWLNRREQEEYRGKLISKLSGKNSTQYGSG